MAWRKLYAKNRLFGIVAHYASNEKLQQPTRKRGGCCSFDTTPPEYLYYFRWYVRSGRIQWLTSVSAMLP